MFDTQDDLLARLTIIHTLRDATLEERLKAVLIFIGATAIAIPITLLLAIGLVHVLF